ncbi:MIF4-like, type 1/2/3 [Ostreococcus tauri]|uniref:MIF4-like, type 1/2/3 n=1 Tax=Ostreococcus tauri TaxID=70448 RepID=Q019C6_OSTTA|nr:MIF4-like, type 1/2/3 [Ostreococcus tauri]CAL53999.1 MIF4-like, type 1/2/3 [Ostreococcus tauri]|eukprot:XP_003079341.1 MIF4-like, type 1/2/3 [Ostreococcus tauri]
MVLLTAEQQRAFDATLRKRTQLEAAAQRGAEGRAERFERKWTDGHGVLHSRASGRGQKGDETVKVLSVIDESPVFALDAGDPNYDSTEEPFSLRSTPGDAAKADVIVEYKRKAETIIDEYFNCSDIDEAWASVERLDAPVYEHFFVKRLVTLAMDRGNREKEAAATLLSALYPSALSGTQIQRGFVRLVESADDLAIDVPDTAEVLGMFIARAIIDDLLPPSFPDNVAAMDTCEGKTAQETLLLAHGHLTGPGHVDRVLRAWGDFDKSPLDAAKLQIKSMLDEYVVTNDVSEIRHCLHDLHMAFFHHEFVKKALMLALEAPKDSNIVANILGLLKVLGDSAELSMSQLQKGYARVEGVIEDLSLDVPDAKSKLEHVKNICVQHDIVKFDA